MPASEANSQKLRSAGDKFRDHIYAAPHGFLLTDASLKLIFANGEAAAILSYPEPAAQNLARIFEKKIRSALVDAAGPPASGNGHSFVKLQSGRRTYVCRSFPLNGNGKGTNGTATLFMLERGRPGRLALSQIAGQFHLTHREQQAVALLLQGLSNKEIAESMGVSANTIKAFLRLATLRMGVSSRSGIVTKVLEVLLSGG